MYAIVRDAVVLAAGSRGTLGFAAAAAVVATAVGLVTVAIVEPVVATGSIGLAVAVVLVSIPVAGGLAPLALLPVYERTSHAIGSFEAADSDATEAVDSDATDVGDSHDIHITDPNGPEPLPATATPERLDDTLTAVERVASRLRRRGLALAAAVGVSIVAAVLAGIAVTLALHAVVLGALTAAGFLAYALGASGPLLDPITTSRVSAALLVLGFLVGTLAVRFADCLVWDAGAGPVAATLESLRVAAANPRSFGAYAAVTILLFAVPSVVGGALATVAPPALAATVSLGLLVLAVAVYAPLHVLVFERRVVPSVCERGAGSAARDAGPSYQVRDRPLVSNPVRVAVVVLLVTGLLVGSASIRAMDVRPGDDFDRPGPVDAEADPAEMLADADPAFDSVNHAYTQYIYAANESTGEWEDAGAFAFEYDYENRRMFASAALDEEEGELDFGVEYYMSTYNFGVGGTGEAPTEPPAGAWAERVDDDWSVTMAPGWLLVADDEDAPVTFDDATLDQEWTVADETDDAVTLRAEGAELEPIEATRHGPLTEESFVEVTLDRETGYVTLVVEELYYAEEGGSDADEDGAADGDGAVDEDAASNATRFVHEFADWEEELDPPEALEPSSPIETYWTIAYY